jgi:ketosteroid isomerase-like protein
VLATTAGDVIRVACRQCDAEFTVEFDPPERPTLRGRIEIIRPPREASPTQM